MSRYAVYELFNGCEAPSNISTFGGYLAGVKVGTSDKNPLSIQDTTYHTSKLVRCKDCVWGKAVDQVGCVRFEDSGSDGLKDPDGFCAWGEKRKD